MTEKYRDIVISVKYEPVFRNIFSENISAGARSFWMVSLSVTKLLKCDYERH